MFVILIENRSFAAIQYLNNMTHYAIIINYLIKGYILKADSKLEKKIYFFCKRYLKRTNGTRKRTLI